MNKLTKPRIALLLAVFLGVPVFVGLNSGSAAAHDGEDHSTGGQVQAQEQEEREDEPKPPANQLGKYAYVAQTGDSYTLLARKAAQTYGKKFDVKLSLADIIFIETHLTQAAGSPQLAVGQQVEIDESQVKDFVDQAGRLSDAEEAAWNYYVQFVDSFNTDKVGQAS